MRAALAALLFLAACGEKEPTRPPPTEKPLPPPAKTPPETPSVTATAADAAPQSAAILDRVSMGPKPGTTSAPDDSLPPPELRPPLPKAADVLPSGEVSEGSYVVEGDGFRYQVPENYQKTDDGFAFSTLGVGARKAVLRVSARREKYKGKLDDYVAKLKDEATRTGATISREMPVKMFAKGDHGATGQRFVVETPEDLDMHIVAVAGGHAYVFRCKIRNGKGAWSNAGSDCMIRGSTFHIAAPPLKK